MMNLLLDTHAFLWYFQGSSNLSVTARKVIQSKENRIYLSIASLWEIAIKLGLGKLEIPSSFNELQQILVQLEIEVLSIAFVDTEQYLTLPLHHRDPFDRMLVAQSITNSLIIISQDKQLDSYPIQRFWA